MVRVGGIRGQQACTAGQVRKGHASDPTQSTIETSFPGGMLGVCTGPAAGVTVKDARPACRWQLCEIAHAFVKRSCSGGLWVHEKTFQSPGQVSTEYV